MLHESETLDEVFSFLSQIDLPTDLTALKNEERTPDGAQEVLSPGTGEFSALSVEEDCFFDELFELQTSVQSGASQAEDVIETTVISSPPSARGTSPTSSSPLDDVPLDTDNRKPKRSRISQKQHIETLRETIRGLDAELQKLMLKWQSGSLSTMIQDVNGQVIPRRASMWKAIAARQLERRLQSEEENAKLRDMLQIQIHEARNLKRVLKRRAKIDLMEDMLGMKRHKMLDDSVPEDNNQVFEDLLRDVDELYVGTDALFAERGLYDLPCPGRHREARRHVTDGLFLELMERRLVPFDIRTTEKAMYKTTRQIGFQGMHSVGDFADRVQFHSHHIEESSNTIKTSVFAETSNVGDVRGAHFRKVVQRYVEKDRVVFVCKMLMEPVLFEAGKPSGFHTRATLRIVLKEEAAQSAMGKHVTRIESHFSATRYDEGLPGVRSIRTSPNLAIDIAAWDETISRIAHHVENLAIDDSCDKSSSSFGLGRKWENSGL